MKQYEIWWADLPKPCVVNCDNLRTISPIPARRIREVKRAVGYALAWEELIETTG